MKLLFAFVTLFFFGAGVAHAQASMTPAQVKSRDAYLAEQDRKDRIAGKALDHRYSLTQRRRMDYELVQMQDRAGAGNALDRANTRFGRKYHLTYDQVIHLMTEAEQGGWPMPPHP